MGGRRLTPAYKKSEKKKRRSSLLTNSETIKEPLEKLLNYSCLKNSAIQANRWKQDGFEELDYVQRVPVNLCPLSLHAFGPRDPFRSSSRALVRLVESNVRLLALLSGPLSKLSTICRH